LDSGIPKDEWDINVIDDDGRNKVELDMPDFMPEINLEFHLDPDNIKKMIDRVEIEIVEEERRIGEELIIAEENKRITGLNIESRLKELGLMD
jgi:hypothetical protein